MAARQDSSSLASSAALVFTARRSWSLSKATQKNMARVLHLPLLGPIPGLLISYLFDILYICCTDLSVKSYTGMEGVTLWGRGSQSTATWITM